MTIQWGDYANNLGWFGPLLMGIGSVTSVIVGWLAGRRDWKDHILEASEKRVMLSEERGVRDRAENADEIDSLTKRFETLIDGYERRIEDLTHEVDLLRTEVVRLRQFIDEHFILRLATQQEQEAHHAKTNSTGSTPAAAARATSGVV